MKEKLYLLCGLPGTGKTTYAKKIKSQCNDVEVFSIDEKMIKKYGILKNQDEFDMYEKKMKDEIYSETKELLKNGKSVVLDFGFWKKKERKKYINIARKMNKDVGIYYFDIDKKEIRRRLGERNKKLSMNNYEITEVMLDRFENSFEIPVEDECHVVVIK